VVVIAGETGSITRYVSWLADTYETQTVRRGEAIPFRPGTDVVVVDHRTLTMAGERARGPIGRRRGSCRVLAPVVLTPCDGLIDGYIAEPVGRDGPLGRVETAMRMATHDASIAEPRSHRLCRPRLGHRPSFRADRHAPPPHRRRTVGRGVSVGHATRARTPAIASPGDGPERTRRVSAVHHLLVWVYAIAVLLSFGMLFTLL
jgi:hypothetical protein